MTAHPLSSKSSMFEVFVILDVRFWDKLNTVFLNKCTRNFSNPVKIMVRCICYLLTMNKELRIL